MLIINADDFGVSREISAGIVHCHTEGVLTSASLMVHGTFARQAAELARRHPALGLGLHWDLDGQEAPPVDFEDGPAVHAELARQLEMFHDLVGVAPTHIDSHHHVHRLPSIEPIARELAAPVGVPLREDGQVTFVGGFYGQWEWEVTDLHHVSAEFLCWILENEVLEGWTEISCHPGFVTGDYRSAYLDERAVELQTLTDPRIRERIDQLGIRVANYRDFNRSAT
jgi:predicted glycoside hydrolase/deacetylase ChbG (UPF0249 family)